MIVVVKVIFVIGLDWRQTLQVRVRVRCLYSLTKQ